jgi:hypothetical protein
LNTEKLKVNKFVFGLNFNIHVKVRILMPQMLHDAVQKALIAEEELTNRGQGRTPARPTGQTTLGVHQHQTPARNTSGYRDMLRGSMFTTPMTDSSVEDSLQRTTHQQQMSPATTISLGMFNRTDQDFRLVGQQLLLRGPGVLDRRPDVGHVESHITNETVS